MPDELVRAFRFLIKLRKSDQVEAGAPALTAPLAAQGDEALGDGAFQECSGLELDMAVEEYVEGGRNDGIIQRLGRAKYSNIVLKRGMFLGEGKQLNRDLWRWIQAVVAGERPVARYNGIIEVWDEGERAVATWTFDRGLPARVRGPELNAKTGEIAIEELHIAHEGLRLEVG